MGRVTLVGQRRWPLSCLAVIVACLAPGHDHEPWRRHSRPATSPPKAPPKAPCTAT